MPGQSLAWHVPPTHIDPDGQITPAQPTATQVSFWHTEPATQGA
jgi:hypothetical protein